MDCCLFQNICFHSQCNVSCQICIVPFDAKKLRCRWKSMDFGDGLWSGLLVATGPMNRLIGIGRANWKLPCQVQCRAVASQDYRLRQFGTEWIRATVTQIYVANISITAEETRRSSAQGNCGCDAPLTLIVGGCCQEPFLGENVLTEQKPNQNTGMCVQRPFYEPSIAFLLILNRCPMAVARTFHSTIFSWISFLLLLVGILRRAAIRHLWRQIQRPISVKRQGHAWHHGNSSDKQQPDVLHGDCKWIRWTARLKKSVDGLNL